MEGEIDGGGDDVRPIVAGKPAATVSRVAGFIPLPWITTTALRKAVTTDHGQGAVGDPASLLLIHRRNPNRFPIVATSTRAFLRSWMTSFSRLRFRRQRASSMSRLNFAKPKKIFSIT